MRFVPFLSESWTGCCHTRVLSHHALHMCRHIPAMQQHAHVWYLGVFPDKQQKHRFQAEIANKEVLHSHTLERHENDGLPAAPTDAAAAAAVEVNLNKCTTSTGGHRFSVSFVVAHTFWLLQARQSYPSSFCRVSWLVKASRHSCEHK